MATGAPATAEVVAPGISKRCLRQGSAPLQDTAGAKASVHFRCWRADNQQLLDDSRTSGLGVFELRLGKKFVMPGWEQAVATMGEGELALFDFSSEAARGYAQLATVLRGEARKKVAAAEGKPHEHHPMGRCCGAIAAAEQENPDLASLGDVPLRFEFELLKLQGNGHFEKESWELTVEERLAAIPRLKEEGNACYKCGDCRQAVEKYTQALGHIERLRSPEARDAAGITQAQADEACQLWVPCLNNLAAAQLKLGDFKDVVDNCSKALEVEPGNVKALFRRGQAHLQRGRDLELALRDVTEADRLTGGTDTAIQKALKVTKQAISAASQREKQMFSGMFGK